MKRPGKSSFRWSNVGEQGKLAQTLLHGEGFCGGRSFDVLIYRDSPTVYWTLQAKAAGTGALILYGKFRNDVIAYEHFLRDADSAEAA